MKRCRLREKNNLYIEQIFIELPGARHRILTTGIEEILRRKQELRKISLGTISKEESEKLGLKLNIQKTKIMASGHITSWEIDGETVETVSDFIFGGSKINVDGECSHEIKRLLLLGRKVMTNLVSIFKSRDITLSTKVL